MLLTVIVLSDVITIPAVHTAYREQVVLNIKYFLDFNFILKSLFLLRTADQ